MLLQKQIDDFFFGNIDISRTGASISLCDLMALASEVSGEYFVSQVNRILRELEGRLVLHHGSSHPEFIKLLRKIPLDSVGKIEIEQRKDVNRNVPCTLACKIYLEYGVVNVQAHWCSTKRIRTEEIFNTLIGPLYKTNLASKTFLDWGNNEKTVLCEVPHDDRELIQCVKNVLGLAEDKESLCNSSFVLEMVALIEQYT